jgi:hypothetical protein
VTAAEGNALVDVFHVSPTSLADGLKKLANSLPELLPSDGVGSLKRKRFWADIVGARRTPEALFEHFRRNFDEITPWHLQVGPEPGTPKEPREGETLTMALPMRGHIQVRCEELTPTSMTFVTLEGHPLAGAVRFVAERQDDKVRFEVQVYDRAANVIDWLAMGTIGGRVQNATWRELVENVVAASGGSAPNGVEQEVVSLDAAAAAEVHRWLERLVVARKREERAASGKR